MIISASRRTDIPAFYADWMMNRIRAGYCLVPNPFNPTQAAHVSLRPEDVDVIVFWTRNPRPLLPHLPELDARGYRYYFQYTLLANPRAIDPHTPSLPAALETFRELADMIGPEKVIWRYDPLVFTNVTGPEFHRATYTQIAQALRGQTFRSVISVVDVYRKTTRRWRQLAEQGIELADITDRDLAELIRALVTTACENGMEIVSCAEELDLRPYGVRAGKCVDDEYIARVFGIAVPDEKDPHQRQACGCVVSRDIGMYDSCPHGCVYCYAVGSFERARGRHAAHAPSAPQLISESPAADDA